MRLLLIIISMLSMANISHAIPNDVNDDGTINISDVISTINMVLGATTPNTTANCIAPAGIDINDVICIINIVLSNNHSNSNITNVQGNIAIDTDLVINGSGFTEKTNAKPLFWWKADFGETPSNLGRKTAWDGTAGIGVVSTTIVAPGSQKSYGTDHGTSSGAALDAVEFDSDRLYLYRKTYEDFDITQDFSIRTLIENLNGTLSVGDVITGATSGATGEIVVIKGNPTNLIQYSNSYGTISDTVPVDFINGEQLTSSSGAVMTNREYNGVLRSFNFKTVRMWSKRYGNIYPRNNIHFSAQGLDGSLHRITPEYTDGATYPGEFTNQPLSQLPREWKVQEIEYQTSDISVQNGIFNFYQKGILGTETLFTNRKPDYTDGNGTFISVSRKYNQIYQSQVSHNAQPGSFMYYDQLYIDDTWHRVLICPEATWSERSNCEVQIPTSWNDAQVTVHVNKGGLDMSEPSYLYVINKNGVANENGWLLP